jgi:hypothetical protein
VTVYRLHDRPRSKALYEPTEKPFAIMVPAWNERGVIGRWRKLAATTLDYEDYHVFVGTYPNDPDTQREVDEVCARFPNVHKVVCARPGPTSKADCLNNVLDAILQFEEPRQGPVRRIHSPRRRRRHLGDGTAAVQLSGRPQGPDPAAGLSVRAQVVRFHERALHG